MKKITLKLATLLSMVVIAALIMSVTSCKKSSTDEPTPAIVLDGYYVKGAVAPYSDYNAKLMMKITKNEVTQTDRASLLELYVPLKAGASGFSIVKVAGSVRTTYGPGADFAVATGLTTDEPKVTFWRGTLAENPTVFTVPTDGMYHVVIDYELMKVAVVPVHWGVIGGATVLGWGGSTALTEPAFNQNTMAWTISNMVLNGGDWKFRYSDGWKVIFDTTLDLGGGNKGVKFNTNFGGAVDALVAGGANIVNDVPGYYTCTLTYTLGSGFAATLTKTGDLPLTDWTGVVCDAIGTGVSIDNPTAAADTSTWHWGNQMLGDNGGIPTKVGNLYTWTWTNIILEADQGFKVRTVNGVAPPSGGANFDAGYSALNVGASAAEIVDDGGNLKATVKGSYTLTLHIDAANSDSKEIIIVKNF
jgi:hypothetical protein